MIQADSMRGRGIAAVAVCAMLWSTGGLFIKIVPWNPLAIAGARSLVAGIVLLFYLRKPRFTWSATQLLCAFSYTVTMISFVVANKLTTAANTILLQFTAPLYAAFLGALILKEKTHWFDWATIGIVVGGMALFFFERLSLGSLWGNVIAAASGVSFAFAMVLLRKQKEGSPLESILLSHFFTFLVSIPFIATSFASRAFVGGSAAGPLPSAAVGMSIAPFLRALPGIGAILFLGIFQTGIANILLSFGVRHVTALQTLLISVIEPIFNPVWVFIVLGETPGPLALIGGAVILVAVTVRSVAAVLSQKAERDLRKQAAMP